MDRTVRRVLFGNRASRAVLRQARRVAVPNPLRDRFPEPGSRVGTSVCDGGDGANVYCERDIVSGEHVAATVPAVDDGFGGSTVPSSTDLLRQESPSFRLPPSSDEARG